MRYNVKSVVVAIIDYLFGFFALALFAAYAYANGHPTEERWESAFLLGGVLALLELIFLLSRRAPANRLIVGANIWLLAGGIAAFFEQWWLLRGYEKLGEASVFLAMLVVGAFFTVLSPLGFLGILGPVRRVRNDSVILLIAVGVALAVAVVFRGDVKLAAVFPIIALAWFYRFMKMRAKNA